MGPRDALSLDEEVVLWQQDKDKLIPDLPTFELYAKRFVSTYGQIGSFNSIISTFYRGSIWHREIDSLKNAIDGCDLLLITRKAYRSLASLNRLLLLFSIACQGRDTYTNHEIAKKFRLTTKQISTSPWLVWPPEILKEALQIQVECTAKNCDFTYLQAYNALIPKSIKLDREFDRKSSAKRHQFRQIVQMHVIWLRLLNRTYIPLTGEYFDQFRGSLEGQFNWMQRDIFSKKHVE